MKSSISKKQLRDFGILIGLGFPIIIGWLIPSIRGHLFMKWTLFIGIPSLILGLWKPLILYYPYKGWIGLGQALGWLNSRIILGLVFILILQPIAFIMKAFGYDPLRTKKSQAVSYSERKQNHSIDLTRIF